MSHDSEDWKKIKERTQPNPLDYDYRLRLASEPEPGTSFSFLVVGDSGSGGDDARAKYDVAAHMAEETEADFLLHVGDVVYLSGSKQGYKNRFINVYHDWIVDAEGTDEHDEIVFDRPFLPVYGNHDYYDYTDIAGSFLGSTLGRLIGMIEHEIGSGSHNGRVFEEAFVNTDAARIADGALPYVPTLATRIPNRYYWFTYGNCAFYALDTNTLEAFSPDPGDVKPDLVNEGKVSRATVERARGGLEAEEKRVQKVGREQQGIARRVEGGEITPHDLREVIHNYVDASKKVDALEQRKDQTAEDYDRDQIAWLKKVLVHDDAFGKWKVVYMHHSLFTSDDSHTGDPQSLGLRANLLQVFIDAGVNLVLSGHSHCFEWVARVENPKYPPVDGDRNVCYVVTGGGGNDLRPSILDRSLDTADTAVSARRAAERDVFEGVAKSLAYTGLAGEEPIHHYLRVEVGPDAITVIPKGVATSRRPAEVESPLPVQVFDGPAGGSLKRLASITVTREEPPHATTY